MTENRELRKVAVAAQDDEPTPFARNAVASKTARKQARSSRGSRKHSLRESLAQRVDLEKENGQLTPIAKTTPDQTSASKELRAAVDAARARSVDLESTLKKESAMLATVREETEKSLLFAQRVRKVELGKARRDVKYKGSGTAAGAKRTASRGGRRA